jgi:hypothetical protein
VDSPEVEGGVEVTCAGRLLGVPLIEGSSGMEGAGNS